MICLGCGTSFAPFELTADLLCLRCVEKARDRLVGELQAANLRTSEAIRMIPASVLVGPEREQQPCTYCMDLTPSPDKCCNACERKL